MTHYEKCKRHRPNTGYKSKTVSALFSEWLEFYESHKPVGLEAMLFTWVYHEFLNKHEEYKGNHTLKARIQRNIIERITNQYWYENQDTMTHELRYKIAMMNIDKFIELCERAITQPKTICNDEPLTGN